MNLCCTHLSVSPLYFPRLHQQWIIAMLSLQKFAMKSKDVTFKFALHLSLVCSLTNCSQMLLVERVWSRIKICLENHQRAISRSIWNPSQQFWFSFSSCVIYIERIAAELRAAQKEIQEKIITLWTSSAGLPFVFFLSAYSAVLLMCVTEKCLWARLFEAVSAHLKAGSDQRQILTSSGGNAARADQYRSSQNQHHHPTKQDADSSEVPTEL